LTCLSQPGELQNGEVPTEGRPTAFIIYLPPCYEQFPEQRYPVLYLLHGQTYTADQWVRLGAPEAADELIHSGQSVPFIMVFPEDRYWNLQQGMYFGQFLLNDILPYIDNNFRTLTDRSQRAIGGLSRGGGWAFEVGVSRPDLFGSLGLHSPAILANDRSAAMRWIRELSPELWPRLYIDMGDNNGELEFNTRLEEALTEYGIPHEWHLNTGAHDEAYWSEHVDEYIQWYAGGWLQP
jgi:enterochelin esterase-like enzyme